MNSNKIEKAYFYNSSQRNLVADIAWLTEKLFSKRNRILVCCREQATVEIIDKFLWAYREDGFIPHSINKNAKTSLYPVLITTEINEEYNHDALLALSGILIKEKDWQRFTKIYYFFDDQEKKEKENARLMWKSFSALDVECKYWVNKENKWILAR